MVPQGLPKQRFSPTTSMGTFVCTWRASAVHSSEPTSKVGAAEAPRRRGRRASFLCWDRRQGRHCHVEGLRSAPLITRHAAHDQCPPTAPPASHPACAAADPPETSTETTATLGCRSIRTWQVHSHQNTTQKINRDCESAVAEWLQWSRHFAPLAAILRLTEAGAALAPVSASSRDSRSCSACSRLRTRC